MQILKVINFWNITGGTNHILIIQATCAGKASLIRRSLKRKKRNEREDTVFIGAILYSHSSPRYGR
jgi:hypothetical protein